MVNELMKLLCLLLCGKCALSSAQLEGAISGHAFLISEQHRLPHHDVTFAKARHEAGGNLETTNFMLDRRQPTFITPPELFDDRHPDQVSAFVFGAFTVISIYQVVIELSLRKHKKLAIGLGLVSFVLIGFTVIKLREVMRTYAYFSFVLGFLGMGLFCCLSYAYFYLSFEDEEERARLVRMQMFSLWLILFLLQLWFAVLQDEKYILRMRAAERQAVEAGRRAKAAERLVGDVDREQQTHLERIRTLEDGFEYHHSRVKDVEERQRQHGSRIKKLERHANRSIEDENAAKREVRGVIDGVVDDIIDEWWPGSSHDDDGERGGK